MTGDGILRFTSDDASAYTFVVVILEWPIISATASRSPDDWYAVIPHRWRNEWVVMSRPARLIARFNRCCRADGVSGSPPPVTTFPVTLSPSQSMSMGETGMTRDLPPLD